MAQKICKRRPRGYTRDNEVRREGQREIRGDLLGYVASKSIVAIVEDSPRCRRSSGNSPLAEHTQIADIGFFSTEVEAAEAEALANAIRPHERQPKPRSARPGGSGPGDFNVDVTVSANGKGRPHFEGQRYAYVQPEAVAGERLIVEPGGASVFSASRSLQWHLQWKERLLWAAPAGSLLGVRGDGLHFAGGHRLCASACGRANCIQIDVEETRSSAGPIFAVVTLGITADGAERREALASRSGQRAAHARHHARGGCCGEGHSARLGHRSGPSSRPGSRMT